MSYRTLKSSFSLHSVLNIDASRPVLLALLVSVAMGLCSVVGFGQVSGTSTQVSKDGGNGADKNLRSAAKVNPSTLALEFSIPFISYPGRSGSSVPIGINYSSKVWQMETGLQWWLWVNTQPRYVTDIRPLYGEYSAAGWSSTLMPPRIDESPVQLYDQNGAPWSFSLFNEAGMLGQWQSVLDGFSGNLMMPCGTVCLEIDPGGGCNHNDPTDCACRRWGLQYCDVGDPWDPPTIPPPVSLYYIKRTRVTMSDGSTHEFRVSDDPVSCGTNQNPCIPDMTGTYLSVDGSGMKLVRTSTASTLYLPGGSRYLFGTGISGEGTYAESLIDADGNKLQFQIPNAVNQNVAKWNDTMGRNIVDPLPHNWRSQTQMVGDTEVDLPAMGTNTLKYGMKWKPLKPEGCEESTDPNCGAGGVNGALEDQTQKLYYETKYYCRGSLSTDLVTESGGEVLFQTQEPGIRPCNPFNVQKDASGNVIIGPDGNPITYATRFNPVVLTEVGLPNGQKYEFKYNRFGEISKITYPTGAYETFVHSWITPLNGTNSPAYDQTNRGVTERRLYSASGALQQRFQYIAETGKITMIASKGDDPMANGAKTERFLTTAYSDGTNYGYSDPAAGTPKEERSYDEYGALRSRTLSKFVTKGNWLAQRDLRPWKSITVSIEGGTALAVKSETEYDENGSSDATFFAHLNPIRSKSYHYVSVPLLTAQSESLTFEQLDALFSSAPLSGVSEYDYIYDSDYKDRGITSLLAESRVLNPLTFSPQGNNEILAKTQTSYDEYSPDASPSLPSNLETTWTNPGSLHHGRPTTVKLWDSDNQAWILTHTKYDQYGNVRKVWEANEDVTSNRFAETEYSADYASAFPTKIITPAPDPTGVHGSSEGSEATTTYDFNTGLALTVTNDLGQTTKTEYNDPLLRPTRVFPLNFSVPESQTIYDDVNQTVKVRKQIDETHWGEATSFMDSLGRTVKTQATDSQGDIFAETEYDFLGRVKRTSNPYRQGDPVLWSSNEYDELGRLTLLQGPDGSKVQTVYGIAASGNSIGMTTTVTDPAGISRRTILNSLALLIRVDEPNDQNQLGNPETPNLSTLYEYDAHKNLKKVTQGSQVRTYVSDNLGRLKSVTNPESGTESYQVDNHGNITLKTDARGVKTHFEYDRANRLIRRYYTDESDFQTPQVEYFYDGADSASPIPYSKGSLTKVSSAVSAIRFTAFDQIGRPLTQIQTTSGKDYQIGYQYNFSGALVEETYPSGRVVRNEFNDDGSLRQVLSRTASDSFRNYANSFSYTATGAIRGFRYGNGRWETSGFNSRLQRSDISLGSSSGDNRLFGFAYQFGELREDGTVDATKNNGNLAKQILSIGVAGEAGSLSVEQTFKYDKLKRLIEAQEQSGNNLAWRQKFVYDRFGNRRFDAAGTTTLPTGCTQAVCNPEIDSSNNRIANGQGYSYDASGNVTQTPENLRSIYDGDNNLAEVRITGTSTAIQKNSYDGSGARVRVEQGDSETVFIHDAAGRVVAEYTNNTVPNTNPNTSFVTLDILGSIRVITDSIGRVITRRDFLPFGEEIASGTGGRSAAHGYLVTETVRPKFTGQERDESVRLDYFSARHYDYSHGRFVSADTVGGKQLNPQSLNLYSYALNNPLRWVDPTGHSPDDPPDVDCSVHDCHPDNQGRNYLMVDGQVYEIPKESVTVNCYCGDGVTADPFRASMGPLPTSPEMASSWLDQIPIVGGLRKTVFNISCGPNRGCNIDAALFGFMQTSVEATPLGTTAREISAARGALLTESLAESGETGITTVIRNTADDAVSSSVSDASTAVVNGNSKLSTNAQHLYEIVNTKTGQVVKTGVSGGKIVNGESVRAATQVRRWNRVEGVGKYAARIVKRVPEGPGSRAKILKAERANASKLRAAGQLDPLKHRRP